MQKAFSASAHSVTPHKAHIRNVAGDYNDNSIQNIVNKFKHVQVTNSARNPLEHLIDNIASGAINDSDERCASPKCHPETRIAVQNEIISWITHGDADSDPKRVLWISGPAGTGKTAIAGTVADMCQKEGLLAASFFFSAFSGSPNRRSKKPLVPTLAYQLLQHETILGLKEEILSAITSDPVVFKKRLDQQLESLILRPLRQVAGHSDISLWPKVIIIDGLDECDVDAVESGTCIAVAPGKGRQWEREQNHKKILTILAQAASDPSFPFRIIIVSRPERVIQGFFSTLPNLAFELFLDEKYDPDADIALFLEAKLSDIRRRFNLPATWASRDVVALLVERASGQFIYAATIIRFIEDNTKRSQEQFNRILEWRHFGDSTPFADLDALYTGILNTSPNPRLAARWLSLLDRLDTRPAWYRKALLESYPGETEYLLGDLTSLINLNDSAGEPTFHFYHKSVIDFLWDESRSANLKVTHYDAVQLYRDRCYQVLKNRGPQVCLQNSSQILPEFLLQFCTAELYDLDPECAYDVGDVDWWWAHLDPDDTHSVSGVFNNIHTRCHWSHCLPACKVWRKGILRHCKAESRRLPTTLQMFQDGFKKGKGLRHLKKGGR